MKGTLEERFEIKVNRLGDCHEWTAARFWDGYGVIQVGRRLRLAHRVAWKLYHEEEPPKGMCVCHTCDNRGCVNPEHLFLGTQGDNMQDMVRKGRFDPRVGELNKLAKLTEAQVLAIRASSETNVALAPRYGVNESAIGKIRRRDTWKHI